jgi:hypothetical protein
VRTKRHLAASVLLVVVGSVACDQRAQRRASEVPPLPNSVARVSETATIYLCQNRPVSPDDKSMAAGWNHLVRAGLDALRIQAYRATPAIRIESFSVKDGQKACAASHDTDCERVEHCQRVRDRTCFGDLGGVYCQDDALARIAQAAAWSSVASTLTLNGNSNSEWWNPTIDAFDGLELAEGYSAGNISRIRNVVNSLVSWHILSRDLFDQTSKMMGQIFDYHASSIGSLTGLSLVANAIFETGMG